VPHHTKDMPNEWEFRNGNWGFAGIKGDVGLAPEEEQPAKDYYRDGDDVGSESHDCLVIENHRILQNAMIVSNIRREDAVADRYI